MLKNITIQIGFIFGFIFLINYFCVGTSESFWAAQMSPNKEWAVMLYKQPRSLHHAPDIVIYQQKKGSTNKQYIHHIRLSEDDQVELAYELEWENNERAVLSLFCETCMDDIRTFEIKIGQSPSLSTISLDSINLLRDRSPNAQADGIYDPF